MDRCAPARFRPATVLFGQRTSIWREWPVNSESDTRMGGAKEVGRSCPPEHYLGGILSGNAVFRPRTLVGLV